MRKKEILEPNGLYRAMLLIRTLETELQKLCDTGEAGDLHFSKGQEAIAVGAEAAFGPGDYVVAHHRTIAHAVARGVPLEPLVAEILGRATGLNGGWAGEMHLRAPGLGFMFSFQLVGTVVPVAAGIAWALRAYRKSVHEVVTVFHGDAATSNGQWHEGLNIAAVQHVPLLLICENNGLAGNVRTPYYLPTRTVAERAAGYGVQAVTVDGNDVLAVEDAVRRAVETVRTWSQPFIVECLTTRLSWHKQGQRDMRVREELAELALRDPLLREAARLHLTTGQQTEIAQSVEAEVVTAIAAARAAPFPSVGDLEEAHRKAGAL